MENADSLDPPLKFFWIISYLKKKMDYGRPLARFSPSFHLAILSVFCLIEKESSYVHTTTAYMVYVWLNMHKTIDFALPFVMAWYLSNTSLFVVSWILIDNAKSERNLYNTMYIHEAKKLHVYRP